MEIGRVTITRHMDEDGVTWIEMLQEPEEPNSDSSIVMLALALKIAILGGEDID